MSRLERDEIRALLIGLLRTPGAMAQLYRAIPPNLWSQPYEDALKIVYAHAYAHYQAIKQLPTRDEMYAMLSTFFTSNPSMGVFSGVAFDVFTDVYKHDERSFTLSYVVQLGQRFVDERVVTPHFTAAALGGAVAERVTGLLDAFRGSRVTGVQSINPFDHTDARHQVRTSPAVMTGCDVFDRLTDGGARAREVMGFLGPYGAGKTALTLNIATACAKRKKHVAVFQYEQQVIEELKPRILACATGQPISEFENKLYEEYSPRTKQAYDAIADIGEYLHFYSMVDDGVTGFGGYPEVQAIMQGLCDKIGGSPIVTLIDWVGAMHARKASAQNAVDPQQVVVSEAKLFDNMAKPELAIKFNTHLLLMNQVTPALASSDIDKRYTKYDAMSNKAFAALQSRTAILLPIDANGVQLMYTDKQRGNAASFWAKTSKEVCGLRVLEGTYAAVPGPNNVKQWQKV
jgi:hypothetical protein